MILLIFIYSSIYFWFYFCVMGYHLHIQKSNTLHQGHLYALQTFGDVLHRTGKAGTAICDMIHQNPLVLIRPQAGKERDDTE